MASQRSERKVSFAENPSVQHRRSSFPMRSIPNKSDASRRRSWQVTDKNSTQASSLSLSQIRADWQSTCPTRALRGPIVPLKPEKAELERKSMERRALVTKLANRILDVKLEAIRRISDNFSACSIAPTDTGSTSSRRRSSTLSTVSISKTTEICDCVDFTKILNDCTQLSSCQRKKLNEELNLLLNRTLISSKDLHNSVANICSAIESYMDEAHQNELQNNYWESDFCNPKKHRRISLLLTSNNLEDLTRRMSMVRPRSFSAIDIRHINFAQNTKVCKLSY